MQMPFLGSTFQATCLFLITSVFAQEPSPSPTGVPETERVIVTGSSIPSAAEVGPDPILSLSREAIDQSGERTTEQLIRSLTVAGPNGVPTSNDATGFTPGASSISLRAFDPSDTLVLIDGRRVANYPIGADGTESFVDLNSIPKAAIASIEILKDSASTTYGADAVAGVVNIKLRHDYHGAEADVEYGNTLDKDSSEFASSLVFGVGDANNSVTGVLNYYHRNSIYNRDRSYSAVTTIPSSNTSPPNLELSRSAVLAAGGNPSPDLGDTFFGRPPLFTHGLAPASDYAYSPDPVADFNFNAFSGSLPDSERNGGFVNAEHKIFGEQMKLYADLFYQNVQTRNVLAASAAGDFATPGFATLAIPPHAPGATLGGPSYSETGVPSGAFNPFNPFQQIISGGTRARLVEFGDRILNDETDAFFSTIGLQGDKLFDGTWGYDASFRYSQIKETSDRTDVSASRFNRILNAADPIFDPNSSQYIGTTVPYNPFGDFRVPIPSNALLAGFASVHASGEDLSKLGVIDLNLYTTSFFKLPAGGVGLGLGGQFRRERLAQMPNELLATGDIIGSPPATPTNASRNTYGLFAESSLPVFSPVFRLPGLYTLEFTAALRFEEFLSNSTNVLVPKFGLRWQPFDDSFTIRATWGEGFHQPSLFQLFGSPQQFFSDVFDPVKGTVVFEIPTTLRSNPSLQTEDSRSFTGGFVYSPKYLSGLTLTVDLFDIETTGRVNSPDIQDLIFRAAAGRLLPTEEVNRDANGNLTSISLAYLNGGSQKARGIDFGLQYQLPTSVGTFTSQTQATYLDSFQFAPLPGEPEQELAGGELFFGAAEGYLKWRANSTIDWAWRGLDLSTTVHYLDGFHEILNFGPQFTNGIKEHWVKQTWFFDVQGSYKWSFGDATKTWKHLLNRTTMTVGCTNVFGHDPPRANTTVNYAAFTYDSTGRFVYVSLRKEL